jgi:hypothetical protein
VGIDDDKKKILELIVINVPDYPSDMIPTAVPFPRTDPEDEKPTERPPKASPEDQIQTDLLPPPQGSVQETIPTEAPPVSVPEQSETRRMDGEDPALETDEETG